MTDLSQNSIKLEGAGKLPEGYLWFPTVMNYNLKHIYLYYCLGDIKLHIEQITEKFTPNSKKKYFLLFKL